MWLPSPATHGILLQLWKMEWRWEQRTRAAERDWKGQELFGSALAPTWHCNMLAHKLGLGDDTTEPPHHPGMRPGLSSQLLAKPASRHEELIPTHIRSESLRGVLQNPLTFEGKEGFFVKGSEVNGSFFVCFLKKSSLVELWNGSLSLKGSPPNGSGKKKRHN